LHCLRAPHKLDPHQGDSISKIRSRKSAVIAQEMLAACGVLAPPIERIDAGMASGVNKKLKSKQILI
jgi:hypothetical protein